MSCESLQVFIRHSWYQPDPHGLQPAQGPQSTLTRLQRSRGAAGHTHLPQVLQVGVHHTHLPQFLQVGVHHTLLQQALQIYVPIIIIQVILVVDLFVGYSMSE